MVTHVVLTHNLLCNILDFLEVITCRFLIELHRAGWGGVHMVYAYGLPICNLTGGLGVCPPPCNLVLPACLTLIFLFIMPVSGFPKIFHGYMYMYTK